MQYDLGLTALGIVVAMALIFGLIAQVLFWRTTHWMWLIGALGYFVGAVLTSEIVFATATEAELQPQIDGLSFDESMLGGLIVGVGAVVVTWLLMRQTHRHGPASV